jgi:Zn-dependent protease with chaperone function
MGEVETGQLILETVPGSNEQAIVDYLATIFKNVSRDKLTVFVRKTPAVLSRNVTATTANKIIIELERLGAAAVYSANGSAKTPRANQQTSHKAAALGVPILEAFKDDLPRVPVSTLYRLALCLVALAMLLLPLIYLALIAGVCSLLYWHVTQNGGLLQTVGSVWLFLVPVVVGSLLVLFMIKPLFVRRASYFRPSKIDLSDEPLLFAFVEKLCTKVGAPMPAEIHLDIQVNASAGFRRGFLSIFGNDLVLTVGLPLVAGLNLHQFAGVLAHEFGHFAQATGMRMSYIIRSINLWFERVVYEEDEWDERIRRWSREWDFRIGFVLLIARFFICITRRILWLLMLLGHAISGFMLRQMEYDADRHETLLVGAEVFESTARRFVELSLAHQWASQDLEMAWEEGRLVDDLPALILANERHIPEDVREKVLKTHLQNLETGLFDTHPSHAHRIANARKVESPPLFQLDLSHPKIKTHIEKAKTANSASIFAFSPSATILFKDFNDRARRVSLDYYRGIFGKEVMPKNLMSADAVVKSNDKEWEYSRALNRFFQGQFSVWRPLGFSQTCIRAQINHSEILPRLRSSRELITNLRSEYAKNLKTFNVLEARIIKAFQTRALLDAGLHLPDSLVDSMDRTFLDLERGERLDALQALEPFEKLVRDRMTGALQLVNPQALAPEVDKGEELHHSVEKYVRVATALEGQTSLIRDLRIGYEQLIVVANQLENKQDEEKLLKHIRLKMEDVRDILGRLQRSLSSTPYPFDHTQARMTLGEFAVLHLPDKDELGPLLDVAYDAADKLLRVYARLVGRLAHLAELAENSLGFPPLPDPPINS